MLLHAAKEATATLGAREQGLKSSLVFTPPHNGFGKLTQPFIMQNTRQRGNNFEWTFRLSPQNTLQNSPNALS